MYEGLLELTPRVSGDGADFTLERFAGSKRKRTWGFYTPDSLVQCLLDSALDPVVEAAGRGKTGAEAERAIPRSEGVRPGGRFRPLPGGRGASPGPASRPGARARGRRERAVAAALPACAPRRHRPLSVRRGHEPDGGRALPREPVAGGAGAGQAALLPRPPHPGGQQPARDHTGADRGGPARRGVQAPAGRRPEGLHRAQEAEPGGARERPRWTWGT